MVIEVQGRDKFLHWNGLERDAFALVEHRDVRRVSMHGHEFLELSYLAPKGLAEIGRATEMRCYSAK